MKDRLFEAERDFHTLEQKKSDFTRDLLAVKLHMNDVNTKISKIDNSV